MQEVSFRLSFLWRYYYIEHYTLWFLFHLFLLLLFAFFPVGDEHRPVVGVQLFGTLVVFLGGQATAHRLFGNPAVPRNENDHRRTIHRTGE